MHTTTGNEQQEPDPSPGWSSSRRRWTKPITWTLTGTAALLVGLATACSSATPAGNVSVPLASVSSSVSTSEVATTSVPAAATTVVPATTRPSTPRTSVAPSPARPRTSQVAPVAPPTTAAPVSSCYPLTNGGNCYEPGEFCRKTDHGATGVAGDGKRIVCAYNNGWRWEPI